MNEILLGIGSSLLTEAIAWVNQKLSTTPLAGKGAFIVSLAMALAISSVKLSVAHQLDLTHLVDSVTKIWAASQVWFYLIATQVGIEVKQH